jgi:hypothetical protein
VVLHSFSLFAFHKANLSFALFDGTQSLVHSRVIWKFAMSAAAVRHVVFRLCQFITYVYTLARDELSEYKGGHERVREGTKELRQWVLNETGRGKKLTT